MITPMNSRLWSVPSVFMAGKLLMEETMDSRFIRDAVVMVCFTTLAVLFNHWWIVLFAILFLV